MIHCLNCDRDLSKLKFGEIEVGGYMLCMGCGHVMTWTRELTLRELTEKERINAGGQTELMRERAKIVPDHSIRHTGTSLVMTCVLSLIIVMAVLEKTGVVRPIHDHPAAKQSPKPQGWLPSKPLAAWPKSP
jgi:hypothetical protein